MGALLAKKRKRRRTKLLTKAINLGVLLLAFARPLQILLQRGPGNWPDIVVEATGGMVGFGGGGALSGGQFNPNLLVNFYGPMVAAIVLKKAISMVRRQVRI